MEPPNQPGQFSAQFIYRWDNSDKLFHFVLCFRFQSEISNIFIQIVIPKIALVLPEPAVPQPPRRAAIQLPSDRNFRGWVTMASPAPLHQNGGFRGKSQPPRQTQKQPGSSAGLFFCGKSRYKLYYCYRIIQIRPLQPSLMIRSMVSCSLMRASPGIRLSLLCSPSLTSSCKLLPKMFDC